MYALWPIAVNLLLAVRFMVGKVFVSDKHRLGKLELQTWVTPACAIEFFFKGQVRTQMLSCHHHLLYQLCQFCCMPFDT